jgi:ankyrin repeat protein
MNIEKTNYFIDAAFYGHLPVVKSLSLQRGVNLNYKDSDGDTAFSRACREGHVNVVSHLLSFHEILLDFNSQNHFGRTAFYLAVANQREDVVRVLLKDKRIDIDRKSIDGSTPLWIASVKGYLNIIKIMMASQRLFLIGTKDLCGLTAVDAARASGNTKIATLIVEYEMDHDGVRKRLQRELGYLSAKGPDGNRSSRSLIRHFFRFSFLSSLFISSSSCRSVTGHGGIDHTDIFISWHSQLTSHSEEEKQFFVTCEIKKKEQLYRFFIATNNKIFSTHFSLV